MLQNGGMLDLKMCGLRVVVVWAHAPKAPLAAVVVVVFDGGGGGG